MIVSHVIDALLKHISLHVVILQFRIKFKHNLERRIDAIVGRLSQYICISIILNLVLFKGN